ncbi:MAG: hypothetical protein AAGI03_12200 [Pseudomonadota bacterium]
MGAVLGISVSLMLPAITGGAEPFARTLGTRRVLWVGGLGPALLISLFVFALITTSEYQGDASWTAFVPFALLALAIVNLMTFRVIGRPFAQIVEERRSEKLKGTFT